MKKINKRKPSHNRDNQLAFSFSEIVPIEIHIPRSRISNLNKELIGGKKYHIELSRS